MTKNQFSQALAMAKDSNIRFIDDNGHHAFDTSIFDGYGLEPFKPVHCTLEQVADLIRWEAVNYSGTLNANALDNLAVIARTKFIVRDNPLKEFIKEVESAHFRTVHDTGANWNAMFIWNLVRKSAGLPPLTKNDLPDWCVECKQYHVKEQHAKANLQSGIETAEAAK